MTIIFFDGPDGSKKTTIAKSVSTILKIPFWERGTYLPHHHSRTENDGDIDYHRHPDAIWYIVDEMKTIETFKRLGANVIVDRHPKVSECVYRRLDGIPSKLEFDRSPAKDEIVVLCHDKLFKDEKHHQVYETYIQVLDMFKIDYCRMDTSKGDIALDNIVEILYQMLPRMDR